MEDLLRLIAVILVGNMVLLGVAANCILNAIYKTEPESISIYELEQLYDRIQKQQEEKEFKDKVSTLKW